MSDIKLTKKEAEDRQRDAAEYFQREHAERMIRIANGQEWERVAADIDSTTDRLRVRGGYLYRIKSKTYTNSSIAMCFVPDPYLEFDGDKP